LICVYLRSSAKGNIRVTVTALAVEESAKIVMVHRNLVIAQTPPTPCLPQRALKPTVLYWRKPLSIHDGLRTCRRPHLPLGGLVARRADAYRVRSASVHTSVMDVMAGF